jgi:hypothetical protein
MAAGWAPPNHLTERAMPEAVVYRYQGKICTTYFAHPNARLPVRLHNGELALVTWGRRQHENSALSLGGWAKLAAIHQGKWAHYSPKPVRIVIDKFMKIDYEGISHWHEIVKGQTVQGLLACEDNHYRVYIVTIVPEMPDIPYDRWPRIMLR